MSFLLLTLRNSGKPKGCRDLGLEDSLGTKHDYLKELADGKNFFFSIYVFKLNKANHTQENMLICSPVRNLRLAPQTQWDSGPI